jgi:polar amino acid transport system substrate-binding protein
LKRCFTLFLAAVLVATSSCSRQAEGDVLRWGADPDGGIPYVFADPENPEKYIGFEVDLIGAISREIGRPIRLEKRTFENLIADVERGDVDLAMNGLEILPERLQRVRFSKPYYLYQLQLAVKSDSPFTSIDEIKAKGKAIGTLGGSAAQQLLDERKIETVLYEEQEGPYRDLALGRRIAGVLLDYPAALYYAAPEKKVKFGRNMEGVKMVGAPFAEGQYGIAVHKSKEKLQASLDLAIDRLRETGELQRILEKWRIWDLAQDRLKDASAVAEGASHVTLRSAFPLLWEGAKTTVVITVVSMLLAVAIGLVVAVCRMYGPLPLRILAVVYVEFFRGIPVLLLLYFLYYGLAAISPALSLHPLVAAILGFGLNYGAYEAEIYRAGFSAIPVGQWEAAASLGMSPTLTFRRIILPQAMRVILPPMTNDFVALFKDTSVVSVIAVTELSKQYQILTKSGGSYLEIGLATAALYLIMSVPLGYLSRYLEHRWGHRTI